MNGFLGACDHDSTNFHETIILQGCITHKLVGCLMITVTWLGFYGGSKVKILLESGTSLTLNRLILGPSIFPAIYFVNCQTDCQIRQM